MLALTYTHSRVSIIEGTLPSAGSGTNTTVPSTPYDYDDIPPTATANSQPTLYHPDDSLSKHKTIHDYQQQEIFKGSSQQRTPRQTLQMKTTKKR